MKALDLYFDFSSPYSYLTVARLPTLAQQAGVHVNYKPIVLGSIFNTLGWKGSPFLEQPRKLAHMWVDLQRQADKHQLPFKVPQVFPSNGLMAARVVTAHASSPWVIEFSQRVFRSYFADDRPLDDVDWMAHLLRDLNVDAAAAIALACSNSTKQLLRDITLEADALGVFGAPSMVVGKALFWGNDRLEDALAHCLAGK